MTMIRLMLKDTLNDKLSLFYAIFFPIGLLMGGRYYIDSNSYQLTFLTGTISLSILFWNLQGLAFQIFRQKSSGVYRLLRITPLKMSTFLSLMIGVRTLISFMINITLLLFGLFLFDISFTAIFLLQCTLIILLASLCFSALGFLISNISKNEGQINIFSNLLFFQMIFCSEAFYSLQSAPDWMLLLGKCFPFHYTTEAFRVAFQIHDGSFTVMATSIIGFSILFFLLSLATFNKSFTLLFFKRKIAMQK
ncbi:ABC transporter permease [Bacillus massiliigorillae]|uniref:ABC transporter permease n=1 Tax=Bacillus massiliigorillae TaxID=1243664 RepID=UPI0003A579D5|nr:ABC transporter permease [Bacillus massiliigorillae]